MRGNRPLVLWALCLWFFAVAQGGLPKLPGKLGGLLGKKVEPPAPALPSLVSVTGEDIQTGVAPVLAEQIVDKLGQETEKPKER